MAALVKRPRTKLNLLDIWDYIADDSRVRADEFLDRLEEKLQTLALICLLINFKSKKSSKFVKCDAAGYVDDSE